MLKNISGNEDPNKWETLWSFVGRSAVLLYALVVVLGLLPLTAGGLLACLVVLAVFA